MVTFNRLGSFGRLGNQMFQIASTIGIAMDNDMKYCFPEWSYNKYMVNKLPTGSLDNTIDVKENDFCYQYESLDRDKDYNVCGYRQSFKYFDKYRNEILYYFELSDKSYKNFDFERSASIHIRRGDYLNLGHIYKKLDIEYFKKILSEIDYKNVYIFSDDIEWCKNNFNVENSMFVENNDEIADLFMMSECKYNIISNSSFSWWAAWINKNEDKKIFAPNIWFEPNNEIKNFKYDDLVPTSWIKIDI